jgi:hypothetical protein
MAADQATIYLCLSKPAFFLSFLSPSANHLLASTSCTIFTHCLNAMTGKLIMQITHGTVLSILLARAISIAAAEKGEAKKAEALGAAGEPGRRVRGSPPLTGKRAGVMVGEEKQRRYRAMKKSSFNAQQTKRTHCYSFLVLTYFEHVHLSRRTLLV